MFYKAKNFTKIIFILAVFVMFLFFSGSLNLSNVFASDETSDAIAVRIFPNPQHYSPATWYKNQGFTGSPTPLEVDGYDAVRDGRTVYVNVANINGKCLMSGLDCFSNSDCTSSHDPCYFAIYTNIYLISYNQDSGSDTISVFNKILEKWKFNTNMINTGYCFPKDTDTVCLTDSECADGDYCDSLKAQITRDIKRLASVVEIREAVEIYKDIKGSYPKLSAGTYLPGRTISTWPSWQTTFSAEIGMIAPLDPINKLGDCGGSQYNETTCWDEQDKSFAGSIPNDIPAGSKALVYSADDNGEGYQLCAIMESGYLVGGEWGDCTGNTIDNNSPEITCGSLSGIVGEKFSGFVSAFDVDGDDLTVTVTDLPQGFSERDTANANQKEIYSDSAEAGANGATFSVDASDGKTNIRKDCTLSVSTESFITYPVLSQRIIIGSSFNFTIYANHTKNEYDGMNFIFEGNLPPEFFCEPASLKPTADGRYQCSINNTPGNIATYNITVYARNGAGAESTRQNFTLEAYNNPPVMNSLNCQTTVRKGQSGYECIVSASDPDGHDIVSYNVIGLPPGMNTTFLPDTEEQRISGAPSTEGIYNINITARDQFGAVSEPQGYTLQVNTFCGDGTKDSPNMESAGGPGNDGREDCDDGNNQDGDGCNTLSNNCTWTCGDGNVLEIEQCDDGNNVSIDACTIECSWTCEELGEISLKNNNTANGLVLDDDAETINPEEKNGTYLKLAGILRTPYIWVTNTAINRISKIRTYTGPKRVCDRIGNGLVQCDWEFSTPETEGSIIGVYDVGQNPSRTSVNSETGDVWVANRNSGNVTKLSNEGELLKTCSTGEQPRGVAIDKNGDIWVANSVDRTIVKISGDDTDCTILNTITITIPANIPTGEEDGGYLYGLAIDGEDNLWVANRAGWWGAQGQIQRIDLNTETLEDTYPAPGIYGITVDLDGNVWASRYGNGVYKLITSTGVVEEYNFGSYGNARGISIDINGSIWIAMDQGNVIKISDPNSPQDYLAFNTSSGGGSIGICGDSQGNVWVVNQVSSIVDVFNNAGNITGSYPVNNSQAVSPYTYSDMTGLNRSGVLRTGIWEKVFDSENENQHWGNISWEEIIPSDKQSIGVYLRVSNTTTTLANSDWIPASTWNDYDFIESERGGRYLEIKIEMDSTGGEHTPVLWGMSLDCN